MQERYDEIAKKIINSKTVWETKKLRQQLELIIQMDNQTRK